VTPAINLARGLLGQRFAAQTHCLRGHPLSGDNLILKSNGTRRCRTCGKAWAATSRERRRARST
jgi:hypothetical protein